MSLGSHSSTSNLGKAILQPYMTEANPHRAAADFIQGHARVTPIKRAQHHTGLAIHG